MTVAQTANPFLSAIEGHLPTVSKQYGRFVTLEAVDQAVIDCAAPLLVQGAMAPKSRDHLLIRDTLLRVAAIAWQAAKDLRLETTGDAIDQDIPW